MSNSRDIDLSALQNMPSQTRRQWRFLTETDSTNAEISRRLADHPPEQGLIVLADNQTGGKGRLGRIWHSAPGTGVYISTLIRPSLPPEQLPILTLMAGLATVIAVNDFTSNRVQLKWPNDLLLNGKKIAGVLCEYYPIKIPAVIIGIGINVNQTEFPIDIKEIATSLKLETGEEINRTALIKQLITQLDFQYSELKKYTVEMLIKNWTRHTDLFGKTITLKKSSQSITGKAIRLDNLGRLVIANEAGEETAFDSGEVRLG